MNEFPSRFFSKFPETLENVEIIIKLPLTLPKVLSYFSELDIFIICYKIANIFASPTTKVNVATQQHHQQQHNSIKPAAKALLTQSTSTTQDQQQLKSIASTVAETAQHYQQHNNTEKATATATTSMLSVQMNKRFQFVVPSFAF